MKSRASWLLALLFACLAAGAATWGYQEHREHLRATAASDVAALVFAYEPVWAIGTGEVCGADEADRVCGVVRSTVASLYGPATADAVRIQYGGSMKPDNAKELLAKPNIDGGLIGGAALKSADFVAIVNAGK